MLPLHIGFLVVFSVGQRLAMAENITRSLARQQCSLKSELVIRTNAWECWDASFPDDLLVKDEVDGCWALERRIGMTASMTGPRSSLRIRQSLEDGSFLGAPSNRTVPMSNLVIGVRLSMCIVDDQSSERKAVEAYRAFSIHGKTSNATVDILLGPQSHYFREAAAQVADEYNKPILMWTMPEFIREIGLGVSPQMSTQDLVDSVQVKKRMIANMQKMTTTGLVKPAGPLPNMADIPGVNDLVEGRLHVPIEHSCARYPVPDGFRLRPNADLLGCDGPCKDLVYCSTPSHNSSVTGSWSPQSALVTSSWDKGCIGGRGQLGARTEMHLVWNLERYKMKARLVFNTSGDSANLVLHGRSLSNGSSLQVVLDGSQIVFQDDGREPATWEVCLLEHCSRYTCPQNYHRVPGEAFCERWPCSEPRDLQACCSLNLHQNPNGPLWDRGLNSVFDSTVPLSYWATDALARARYDFAATSLACIAISEGYDFATTLCESYLNYGASELGYLVPAIGTISVGLNNISEVAHILDSFWPEADAVLMVGNVAGVGAALQRLQVALVRPKIVINALPSGSIICKDVNINAKHFRYFEPVPWAPPEYLFVESEILGSNVHEIKPSVFAKVYAEKMSKYGSIIIEDMLLSSAVLAVIEVFVSSLSQAEVLPVLEKSSTNATNSTDSTNATRSTSRLRLFQNSAEQDLLNFAKQGAMSRSLPSSSRVEGGGMEHQPIRFDVTGLLADISRRHVGTRMFNMFPAPNKTNETYRFTAATSWEYMYARYVRSRPQMLETNSTIRAWGLQSHPEVFANVYDTPWHEMTLQDYPCPPGCQVDHYRCSACSPGKYRALPNLFCLPCPKDLFADHYAAFECRICPKHATCRSPTSSPDAKKGFYRIKASSAKQDMLQGQEACLAHGGLALLGVADADMREREHLHRAFRWRFIPCDLPSACLGNQTCRGNNTGFLCSNCVKSFSNQHGWEELGTCKPCRETSRLAADVLLLALCHAAFTVALSRATSSSAMDATSLAAPLALSYAHKIQLISFVTEIAKSTPAEGFNWFFLGTFLTKPAFNIMLDCEIPMHSVHDVLTHHLLALAYIMAGYVVIVLFFACRLAVLQPRAARFWGIVDPRAERVEACDDAIRYATCWTILMAPSGIYSCVAHCLHCRSYPEVEIARLYVRPDLLCDSEWESVLRNFGVFTVAVMLILQFLPIIMLWRNRCNLMEIHTRRRYCLMYAKLRNGWRMWFVVETMRINMACFTLLIPGIPHQLVLAVVEAAYLLIFLTARPYMMDNSGCVHKLRLELSFGAALLSAIGYSRQFGEVPYLLDIANIGVQSVFFFSGVIKLYYDRVLLPWGLDAATGKRKSLFANMNLRYWGCVYGLESMRFAGTCSEVAIATSHHTRYEQAVITASVREAFNSQLDSNKLRFSDVSTGFSKALHNAGQSHRAEFLEKCQKQHAAMYSKKPLCREQAHPQPGELTMNALREALRASDQGVLAEEFHFQCHDQTLFHPKQESAAMQDAKIVSDYDAADDSDSDADHKEAKQTGAEQAATDIVLGISPAQDEMKEEEPESQDHAPDEVGQKLFAALTNQTVHLHEEIRVLKKSHQVLHDRARFASRFEAADPDQLEKLCLFAEKIKEVGADIKTLKTQLAPPEDLSPMAPELTKGGAITDITDNAISSLRKRPILTSIDRRNNVELTR
eukprot:TRINITY_DN2187_c0_g1_i2.p1 TRINITY_DN2187_c0_g1~~TRINITY_DN2187_c0_g1_i2.p1  ORF type:complete len:1688 (-),score=217.41 TRINITY_DN2187_c0_g1_i2:150-5213(-)